MDAAQNIPSITDSALYQSDMVLTVQAADKSVRSEMTVLCRHIHFRHLFHQLFAALAVFL